MHQDADKSGVVGAVVQFGSAAPSECLNHPESTQENDNKQHESQSPSVAVTAVTGLLNNLIDNVSLKNETQKLKQSSPDHLLATSGNVSPHNTAQPPMVENNHVEPAQLGLSTHVNAADGIEAHAFSAGKLTKKPSNDMAEIISNEKAVTEPIMIESKQPLAQPMASAAEVKGEGRSDEERNNNNTDKMKDESKTESYEAPTAKVDFYEDRRGNADAAGVEPVAGEDSSSSGGSESESSSEDSSEDDSSADATQSGVPDQAEASVEADAVLSEAAAALRDMQEEEDAENGPLRTKNEKDHNSIPIERPNVQLSVSQKLSPLGSISGVMDKAVIVMSDAARKITASGQIAPGGAEVVRQATALDAGSVLWFADRKMLGAVFETFGPVTAPFYIVRFNSNDEIDELGATTGREVFFVEDLCSKVRAGDVHTKGYDSSNIFDEETHGNQEEFSDDEAEAAAKRRRKRNNKLDPSQGSNGPPKRSRGGNRQGRDIQDRGFGARQQHLREDPRMYGGRRGAYEQPPMNAYNGHGPGHGNFPPPSYSHFGPSTPMYGSAPWITAMPAQANPYNMMPMNPGVALGGAQQPPQFPPLNQGYADGLEENRGSFNPYSTPSNPFPHHGHMYSTGRGGWSDAGNGGFHPHSHHQHGPRPDGNDMTFPPPYAFGNQLNGRTTERWPGSSVSGGYHPWSKR